MSDYLAVAGVSAVLKALLHDALSPNGPNSILGAGPGITALAPDLIDTGAQEQAQLNLFMYYASLNAAYRNAGLPSSDNRGQRLSNPPLGLNLHYLISAYGNKDFDAEILLAWAMQVFHENPVLAQSDIQSLLTAISQSGQPSPEVQLLVGTTLASQVESIKITPEALSNEEISRLWMAFQTHYRPTTSYQVSVVLIQNSARVRSNLPVQSRNISVIPIQPPRIDNVSPTSVAPGEMLTIAGRNFVGDTPADTLVQFDDAPPVPAGSVQAAFVRIQAPSTLHAGVREVRVVRRVSFGVPTDPHDGWSSNPVQFILVPTVTTVPPITAAVGSTLTLNVSPPVGRLQRVNLLIGDDSVPLPERPPSSPDSTSALGFPIPADFPHSNPAVSLPVRVQVDGAQSRLKLDQTPGSPTFGQFLPQAQITGP
jgi:hypothetical protein